jgi:hypothetical protein
LVALALAATEMQSDMVDIVWLRLIALVPVH